MVGWFAAHKAAALIGLALLAGAIIVLKRRSGGSSPDLGGVPVDPYSLSTAPQPTEGGGIVVPGPQPGAAPAAQPPVTEPSPGPGVGDAPTSTGPGMTVAVAAPTYSGSQGSLPDPSLPAYAPIPGTLTHPGGNVQVQNIPTGSNIHQPGMQLD